MLAKRRLGGVVKMVKDRIRKIGGGGGRIW